MKNFKLFEKLWEHSRTLRRVGLVLVMCLMAIPQLWGYSMEIYFCPEDLWGGYWDEDTKYCQLNLNKRCNGNDAWETYSMTKTAWTKDGKAIWKGNPTNLCNDGAQQIQFLRKRKSDNYQEWSDQKYDGWMMYNSTNTFYYGSWQALSKDQYVNGGYVYFDNSQTGWTTTYKYLVIGRDAYSRVYALTRISNTDLWYVYLDGAANHTWEDATYCAFIGSNSTWSDGAWGPSNVSNASNYTATFPVNYSNSILTGRFYLYRPASSENGTELSRDNYAAYSGLNWDITFKAKIKAFGEDSYEEGASKGKVSVNRFTYGSATACNSSSSKDGVLAVGGTSGTYTMGYVSTRCTLKVADVVTGYTFRGWYAGGTKLSDDTPYRTYSPRETTVYAYFEANSYTITYNNMDGATNHPSNPSSYGVTSSTITLQAPTKDGYVFAGWCSDDDCKTRVTSIPTGSTGNKVFYAKWLSAHEPGKYVTATGSGGYGKTLTDVSGIGYERYLFGVSSSKVYVGAADKVTSTGSACVLSYATATGNFDSGGEWLSGTAIGNNGSGSQDLTGTEFASCGTVYGLKLTTEGQGLLLYVKGYSELAIVGKDNDKTKGNKKYLQVKINGSDETKDLSTDKTIRRYTLTPGTAYTIQITSLSNQESQFWGFSLKPGTPTITSSSLNGAEYAQGASATPLSVTATKLVSSGTSLSYQWYANTTNEATVDNEHKITGATSASYTPPTTSAGTKYYYCVVSETGCNSTTSSVSGAIIVTAACSATAPGSISKGTASGGTGTITLTADGSPATNNTWYWQASEDGTSTSESGKTKNVSAEGTYYIRSYCSDGSGCWSAARSVTVDASDLLTPITPSLTYASTVTYGSTINPTLTGNAGSGAVTYSLNSVTPASSLTINSSTGAVTGATAGGTATVTATIAANGNYAGGSATSSTITVAKAALSVTATAGTATSVSHNSATLPFTLSSTTGVASVTIEVYKNSDDSKVATISGVTAATSGSASATGLSASTKYYFMVTPIGDANHNDGTASAKSSTFTTEAAPSLTALVDGTLYKANGIFSGDIPTSDTYVGGISDNGKFFFEGSASASPHNSMKWKDYSSTTLNDKEFTAIIYFEDASTLSSNNPTTRAMKFILPSAGTLTIYYRDNNNGAGKVKLNKSGSAPTWSSPTKGNNYATTSELSAGTYYLYATGGSTGIFGVQFDATDDKTEPTVTWSGVPATVYPGQQFTFTVETNTDASLDEENLTATNATLVNQSRDGGVFTATAQIAANASSAPTFTLSTEAGTDYAAKDDEKSGITLGSCESSEGVATLFSFTCTSSTTATNAYTATGGTATLSGSAMSTSGSNEVTISDQTFYKFNSSSTWTIALKSGTFAAGDVITFTMACNTSSDKSGKGVMLISSSSDTIPVTRNYPKNTAQTSSYTVLAGDGIAGQSSFTIKRNDSDIKFGSITITRDGQTINSKQETTIEWPETVDGVRVVEYDAKNPNIPSLAIISSIGEATYTSNNEDVGSFRDGNVELAGATGNVTITVSVAAAGCMEAAESSYVLTVTNKRYTVEKGTITGTGCDVSISSTSVPSGDIVTLTPVPATGYSLTSWDVYKKDDSSTKVTVTNNRFTMPDYDVVVDATFTAKSTVATLSALSVTNADTDEEVTLDKAFASGTTSYNATLSCGTTSAPRISATKTDSKATVRLTNVSDLSSATDADRTATILVTAEDGETTKTYTIVFTVSNVDCVRLSPTITSLSGDEDICSGGTVDLSIEAASRNNDGGTLSYQWQKYNTSTSEWDNITGATETEYTSDAITAETQFRCVVTDTKDASAVSTNSDAITIGVTSVETPTYTQGANVVTLSCATEGATIWYSTDGETPAAGADNSRQGTSVSITSSGVTVKAIAYLDGCHSDVMTLSNAEYSASVAGSITWAMTNAGKAENPKFSATCVPNTVLSAATAFQLSRGATYDKDKKENMSVKISGITSYDANGKHVTLAVTVAEGYTFTPCSLSVDYQPVSKAANYRAVIGSNTSSESSSVSGGSHSAQIVNFTSATPISAGTDSLHLYVYGTDLVTWRVAGNIILYGTVQATATTYYSVTYNRNGATSGSVPVDDNRYENGETVELAANTGNLAKTGYIFSGWATTSSGTVLTSNPTITDDDMTLYAVWTEDESAQTEACANVTTSGTQSSIAVGDYSLYFSSSNSEYTSGSVKSSTANKCEGECRYYMPGVVVALTNSNASTIKLKGQQDYDVTVSKVMVADALDGAWREISYTPIAYSSSSCGVLGISGVQIAQGKYVFLGFSGGAKNEFRISGLCITPFVDACPAISIAKNPVGDTWAQGATGVQISVGATTASGTLTYQWQESTDNTNFSNIASAEAATFAVPTGTVGTKYYRCVVSNGSCSKNSESAKMVIVEPTVTALYDYWYIKQGRLTPDIALFEVTKGTPASNVTIPATSIGQYSFVYNTSDYKIYLQGSAPSAIYSDEDVEVTASIKSNSNADNITLHLLRATPHPQLAFVVTNGDGEDGFENYNTSQIDNELYNQLALDYIIQPTNIYYTTDEKAIRAYYSQFDIILNTDYPDTQKGPKSNTGQWNVGYVNALGTMVDIVPILTMEAFISRLPNWKIKQDPKSPSTNQYKMLLNCRAHEIFTGIPEGNMGTEIVNGEDHKVVTIVDENGYDTKKKALQGFAADDLADMDVVGQIHNGTGQLMACVERQYETTARMMVLGINSSAMEKLTEDGIKVVKNALLYLQHKSAKDVNDCSVKFTNNEGAGNGQWSTASNWSTGVVPNHENKVIILADCELDEQAHVDMVKINEDVKLTIKPTGALIVDGTITRFSGEDWLAQDGNITSDNLVVEADASHTGALILSNPDSKVGAEVQMYSKAHYDNVNSKDLWQFVAIPIVSASRWNMGDWAYVFNNAGGDWDYYRDVYSAFDGIGLTQDDETTYTFRGPLASTKTQNITLYYGNGNDDRTLIGNSWTAPIQIVNFDESKDFGTATPTVYVYNTGFDAVKGQSAYEESNTTPAAGSWYTIPIGSAKTLIDAGTWVSLTEIPAMQTFEVQNTSGANTTLKLDYDALVRKDASSLNQNTPMYAPRRANNNNNVEIPSMRITLVDEATRSDVYLLKADRFTNGFEGGWDGDYRVDDDADYTQFYIVQETGKLAISAQPEMDGTFLGFVAGRNASYTITFRYNGNEELYFNDLETQQSTLITDENEYTFMAERGEKGNRFLIGGRLFGAPEITTGVTNLDAEDLDVQKVIYNDKLFIIRGGKVFSADGQLVK